MFSRSYANRLRTVSQISYVSDMINLTALAALATRSQATTDEPTFR